MKVIQVTDLSEFQFFILRQIYIRQDKHFKTVTPFNNVFINAYPDIKYNIAKIAKLENKGLYLPSDFRNGICFLKFMVQYEIYKREYSKELFVEVKFKIPHYQVYNFLVHLKDYQENRKQNKLIKLTELVKIFEMTSFAFNHKSTEVLI